MFRFRIRFRRRGAKVNTRHKNALANIAEEPILKIDEADARQDIYHEETSFAIHMSKYIGETVTVFVKGGGISGKGFTGVLLCATSSYIKLLSRKGFTPACPLGISCFNYYFRNPPTPYLNGYVYRPGNKINMLGANTYIPVDKIASFIHNAI